MRRLYISGVVGDGLSKATAFRPALSSVVAFWVYSDGRVDPASSVGRVLVEVDVTPAQHTAIVALAAVTYLPFEGASGPLDYNTAVIGDVTAANRTALRTRLEAWHVSTIDLSLQTPLREVVRRIRRRLILRQLLGADDYTEGLDTLVSALTATRRTRLRDRLLAIGFDVSDIQGTDTIREALRKLAQQDAAAVLKGT